PLGPRKALRGEAFIPPPSGRRFRRGPAALREGGPGQAAPPQRRPLTLLYAAKNTEQNHARVLAAWLAALPVTI
ncbi:DUF488 domain-containing protein, partial [Klebsiella pneumoniae]